MKKPDMIKILYFLRGLGIGIIVTIIVVTIHKAKEPISDTDHSMTKEEIIQKAKDYGLVEPLDNKVAEILGSPKPSISPKVLQSSKPEGAQ